MERQNTPFPWAEAMSFGLGVLRLNPTSFWAMTPRELASAYQGIVGNKNVATLNRSAFVDLMSAFPDEYNERSQHE